MAEPLLEVRDLTISVEGRGGRSPLVSQVSFSIDEGGTVGLVGESGSGKTLTSLAIMGLLPPSVQVESGEILFEGDDLLRKGRKDMQKLRGRRIGMVMQDSLTALDPSFTIREQLSAPLRQHRGLTNGDLDTALVDALQRVHLPAAQERLRQYPHQLSGGMRQRATSAIALAGGPRLLIADEPTTALDVTTQARYLQLLRELQRSTGFSLLLVTHDLLVVRHVCQRVVMMYSSEVVETGSADDIFDRPDHPYTSALIGAIPVLAETVELESIEGQAPDPSERIDGCRFAQRCPHARDVCEAAHPQLNERADDRLARCWGTEPEGWIPA